ncbi:MAG: type VI secretion system baseplate subunit TssG [Nitrosomonas sp.]|nr:type VI secretion system baseplate subunit TssG [Nitrosomonas sp.]
MASQIRNQDSVVAVLKDLQQEPYKYDFYQFVRLIECMYPDKQRFGYSVKPSDDAIRMGQLPFLQFAPTAIATFEANAGHPAALKVFFFGLFGPNGSLPTHLTEYARNRMRVAKDPALAEFADLFHHRLLSLFYRAWADKEPTVQLDRPQNDRFSFYVGSLLGIAERSQQQRDGISDHAKLHFAIHMGGSTKHVSGLIAILHAYFQVSIAVEEFVGEWLTIPKDSLCHLNTDQQTGQLGISATIGRRSWQCMHKFRIVAGPLDLQQFQSLLPNGEKITAFSDLVKNYIGFEFKWDLNLILKKEEVPTARLGKHSWLGWNSWLATKSRTNDARDMFIDVEKNS